MRKERKKADVCRVVFITLFIDSFNLNFPGILFYPDFATFIGLMLDPSTHNRPFADKHDKVGMDGVPNCIIFQLSRVCQFMQMSYISKVVD